MDNPVSDSHVLSPRGVELRLSRQYAAQPSTAYNQCPDSTPMVEPIIHGSWFHTHAREFTFFVGLAAGFLMGWITHIAFGKRGAEREIH